MYFKAIHDPFIDGIAPCIPSQIPQPSMKYSVTTRGDFNISTAGYGGVAFWPFRMLFNDYVSTGIGVVAPALVTSKGNSTADKEYPFTNFFNGSVPIGDAGNEYLYYPGTTSQYTAATFAAGTGRAAKLVAAGIRVWSMGEVLKSKGSYIIFAPPGSVTWLTADNDTVTKLLGFKQAVRYPLDKGQPVQTSYTPQRDTDLQTVLEPGTFSSSLKDLYNRLACMILIENGDPAATYTFEAIAHFELYGTQLPTTPSHADPHAVPVAVGAKSAVAEVVPSRVLAAGISSAQQNARDNGVELNLQGLASPILRAVSQALVNQGKKKAKQAGLAVTKRVFAQIAQSVPRRLLY